MAYKRIIIAGGNGFVGLRICKFAIARGWDVTSLSRSGAPNWSAVSDSPFAPSWAHKVTWARADVLDASSYRECLHDADYVVHTLGILLETNYKDLIHGTGNILSAFSKVLGSKNSIGNPFGKIAPAPVAGGKSQLNYEVMNRDSVISLAHEAAKSNVKAFAMISASACPPGVPTRYLLTKRQAEHAIARDLRKMRSLFIRAPFMYDPSRKFTMGVAAANGAATLINDYTKGLLGSVLKMDVVKPLLVDTVAQAVIEGLAEEEVEGAVEVEQIEELGNKGWRNSML